MPKEGIIEGEVVVLGSIILFQVEKTSEGMTSKDFDADIVLRDYVFIIDVGTEKDTSVI